MYYLTNRTTGEMVIQGKSLCALLQAIPGAPDDVPWDVDLEEASEWVACAKPDMEITVIG